MKPVSAIAGSALFFLVAPGVVAGAMPWLLTDWTSREFVPDPLVQIPGGLMIAAGVVFLVHAFGRFALEGRGTPAPVAPTERLVVGGVYRFVRNPMYLAVVSIILGQALIFRSSAAFLYAVLIAAMTATFVKVYEEPELARTHGADYEAYRKAVPGWWPRLTPWRGPSEPG